MTQPMSTHTIRFGTLNISRGLQAKICEIVKLFDNFDLDILGLQETGSQAHAPVGIPADLVYFANPQGHGVGLITTAALASTVTAVDDATEGVLSLDAEWCTVSCVYQPSGLDSKSNADAALETARARYQAAIAFAETRGRDKPRVMLGDLNEVASRQDASVAETGRGRARARAVIPDTYVDVYRDRHPLASASDATFYHSSGWSRLDHILLCNHSSTQPMSPTLCQVHRVDGKLKTGHCLLIAEMEQMARQSAVEPNVQRRFIRVSSASETDKATFAADVEEALRDIDGIEEQVAGHWTIEEVGALLETTTRTVVARAKTQLGTTAGTRAGQADRKRVQLSNTRRRLRALACEFGHANPKRRRDIESAVARMLNTVQIGFVAGTVPERVRQAIAQLRARSKRLCQNLRSARVTVQLFARSLKRQNRGLIATVIPAGKTEAVKSAAEVQGALNAHFGRMLKAEASCALDPTWMQEVCPRMVVPEMQELLNPISAAEVRDVLCSRKCRWVTAADVYGLTEGVLRTAATYAEGDRLIRLMASVFSAMIRLGDVPRCLKTLLFHPFFKKCSLRVEDCRPITLLPAFARVFYKILAARELRLTEACETFPPEVKAFLPGRSAFDAIAESYAARETAVRQSELIWAAQYDLDGAYDSIVFDVLERALLGIGYPEQYVKFCICRMTGCSVRVLSAHGLGDPLPMQKGLRQGDPTAPIHFNAINSALAKRLRLATENPAALNTLAISQAQANAIGVQTRESRVNCTLFADDWRAFGRSESGIRAAHELVVDFARHLRLKINGNKSIAFTSPEQRLRAIAPLSSGGVVVSVDTSDKTVRYLGVKTTPSGSGAEQRKQVTSIVAQASAHLHSRALSVSGALAYWNRFVAAKIVYHTVATTWSLSELDTLDSTACRGLSAAAKVGFYVAPDVFDAVFPALQLPSVVASAGAVAECLRALNAQGLAGEAARTALRSGNLKTWTSGQLSLALAIGIRATEHSRALRSMRAAMDMDADDIVLADRRETVELTVQEQTVLWRRDSQDLFRQAEWPAATTITVLVGAVLEEQKQTDIVTVTWAALVWSDELEQMDTERILENSPRGIRARSSLPAIAGRSRVLCPATISTALATTAAAVVLTVPANAHIQLLLTASSNVTDSMRRRLQGAMETRKSTKLPDYAPLCILQRVMRRRTSVGGSTHLGEESQMSERQQAWIAVTVRAAQAELLHRGSLPDLRAAHPHVSMSTDGLPLHGAPRKVAASARRRQLWHRFQERSKVAPALSRHCIRQQLSTAKRWLEPAPMASVLRLFLLVLSLGRHVHMNPTYGAQTSATCNCSDQQQQSLLHALRCPTKVAARNRARQHVLALLPYPHVDRGIQPIISHCEQVPLLCLGLEFERVGIQALTELQQVAAMYFSACTIFGFDNG